MWEEDFIKKIPQRAMRKPSLKSSRSCFKWLHYALHAVHLGFFSTEKFSNCLLIVQAAIGRDINAAHIPHYKSLLWSSHYYQPLNKVEKENHYRLYSLYEQELANTLKIPVGNSRPIHFCCKRCGVCQCGCQKTWAEFQREEVLLTLRMIVESDEIENHPLSEKEKEKCFKHMTLCRSGRHEDHLCIHSRAEILAGAFPRWSHIPLESLVINHSQIRESLKLPLDKIDKQIELEKTQCHS